MLRGDLICGNNNGCDISGFADITADDIVTTTADFTTAKIKTVTARDNALGTGYDLDGVRIYTTVDGEASYSPPIEFEVISGGKIELHDGNGPDHGFDGVTVSSGALRLTTSSAPAMTSSTVVGLYWLDDQSPAMLRMFDGASWQDLW